MSILFLLLVGFVLSAFFSVLRRKLLVESNPFAARCSRKRAFGVAVRGVIGVSTSIYFYDVDRQ